MNRDPLFHEYSKTPRPLSLAPALERELRKAWLGVPIALLIAVVFGIILWAAWSPVRRGEWLVNDLPLVIGITAAFTLPMAFVGVFHRRKYIRLFRAGRLVEGAVIQQGPESVVLRLSVASGPDHAYVLGWTAADSERFPVIIGLSSTLFGALGLVVAERGELHRAVIVTAEQLSRFPGQAS
jgi:hypothetical protein